MTRIAKTDVHAAFDHAAKTLKDAAGTDGVATKKEVKDATKPTASPAEKALTDQFFKFLDARDPALRNKVNTADMDKALEFAKQHLVNKYDVNNNGLSQAEIAKMSKLGKLAVDFAVELRRSGGIDTPPPNPATDLGQALATAVKDTYFMSESDYPLTPVGGNPANQPLSAELMRNLFGSQLKEMFKDEPDTVTVAQLGCHVSTAAETQERLTDLATPYDPNDDYIVKNSAGFQRLKDVLNANLTDVRMVKIGQPGDHGDIAQDQGLYALFFLGKTADGKLAGVMTGTVET